MKIRIIFFSIVVLFFMGCQKEANEVPWGKSLLYIPQAVLQSGGQNNNFVISIGDNDFSDTSIVVGLYRSGLAPLSGVSVDVTIDTDTLNKAISKANEIDHSASFDIYEHTELLNPEYYSLPKRIKIADGERAGFIFLNLKRSKLITDSDFEHNKFILPIRIENPSKYTLNNKLSLVMLIFEKE